ncbi:hypothetical protein AN619_03150 [Thermotalea metallivorans]|uniref:Uncharacterized protein n=1 Tax=Thermotalea metallivorans TaxID=520762 RepID=A0A140LBT0_9FIRM|nr:hypothetical protein AN619_03150 [Thermotalea metallivorans]
MKIKIWENILWDGYLAILIEMFSKKRKIANHHNGKAKDMSIFVILIILSIELLI